ncbi:MAG: extracellular solute-binding protein [Armatimonadetes bacterium]|nr:extracellular solute-binding protein [Armatimonadota bacterium]
MAWQRCFLPLLALLPGIVMAGPGEPAPDIAKKRDLVIWGVAFGPDTKGIEAVVREFQRRHQDINVRVLSMGAGAMNPQKLMTSIVGNVAPDVISQDRFSIADWASRGAFQSLSPLLERDKNDPLCPKPEQYYKAPWEEATYEGQVYGIPTGADNRILYYNKKIFREKAAELRAAGLDPERAPRTWSEVLKYSEIITEKNKDGTLKRAGFMPNFGNSWLYMYSFQNNASFMSPDGKKCTLDSPASEEALNFMVKGYDLLGGYEKARSFESGFLGKENDAFIIGKVAMKIDGDWIISSLARYGPALDFGVAPAPVPDDRYNKVGRFKDEKDTFVTWMGGFSYAIPRGARNTNDGWEFIKFATSTEGRVIEMQAQQAWDKLRGRVYVPRQLASREANEIGYEKFRPGIKKYADAVKMHLEMAQFGRIRPATFVGQTLWNEHVKAMEAACYHKMSPKAALLAGQAAVQRDLDAFFTKSNYPVVNLAIPGQIAIIVIVLSLLYFVIHFTRLRLGRLARTEAKWAYLFISPWVLGFVVLILGPMVASLFFSFTQYDVLNEARWVGFRNYHDIATVDWGNVSKALGNAIYLAGVGVPLSLATGLAIALLLNTAARGMRFYRTFFYVPAIVPGVASAVLWMWVLTPDANKGLVNSFWQSTITQWLSIAPPGWIQSADWSKPALILMGVWGAGSGMVLWLAGLKGVPTSLYEAAGIDGASNRQLFWSITFPQLSPIIFFNMVMGFIGAMQEFDRQYIMKPSSDGPIGPDDSMLTPVYYLFRNGFETFKMGYASSLAWLIFAIIVILTFAQFKLSPRWVHYENDK